MAWRPATSTSGSVAHRQRYSRPTIGYASATHRQTLTAISSLERFVDSLAGLPGRKAILHVSDGLPLIAGRGPNEYIIELCGGFEAAARGVENNYDYGTASTTTPTSTRCVST